MVDFIAALAAWFVLPDPLVAACLTIVSPILVCFGFVEVTLGIIAEVLIRMHYEIQNKAPYRIRTARNLVLRDARDTGSGPGTARVP